MDGIVINLKGVKPRRFNRGILTALAAVVLVVAVFAASARKATASHRATTPGQGDGAATSGPPPDGKYENVTVEGRIVPMIHLMNGGSIVLVDTDGAKPRTWEEQYKRKGEMPNGTFDIHKTNVNGNDTFADDPVDRKGRWVIDSNANIRAF